MVTSDDEIARRLEEIDSPRSARRQHAAAAVGRLARRHTELAGQLADLEHDLGEILTAAGDVIDVPELAAVTGIPVDDLARWHEQVAKPARGGKRKRPSTVTKSGTGEKANPGAAEPRAARPAAPEPVGDSQPAVAAASS